MVDIRIESPDDDELLPLMETALALAQAEFGTPTNAQVEKIFIRLIFEQSNGIDGDD